VISPDPGETVTLTSAHASRCVDYRIDAHVACGNYFGDVTAAQVDVRVPQDRER
jgi:hypothetical protein